MDELVLKFLDFLVRKVLAMIMHDPMCGARCSWCPTSVKDGYEIITLKDKGKNTYLVLCKPCATRFSEAKNIVADAFQEKIDNGST